jgi:hypothetical protein
LGKGEGEGEGETYSTYDVLMVGQMCFAVLAAVDLVTVQVDVV